MLLFRYHGLRVLGYQNGLGTSKLVHVPSFGGFHFEDVGHPLNGYANCIFTPYGRISCMLYRDLALYRGLRLGHLGTIWIVLNVNYSTFGNGYLFVFLFISYLVVFQLPSVNEQNWGR